VINQYPEKFETAYNNRAYYYYLKGTEEKNEEYLKKAEDDYSILEKMGSTNPFVYSVRGNIEASGKHYDKAISYFSKSLKLDSTNFNTLINRALTYIKIEKYDLSLADVERSLKYNHQRQGFVLQAYNYFMLGNYIRAIELYSSLIKNFPGYKESYYYRGNSYFRLGENENALKDLIYYKSIDGQKVDLNDKISEIKGKIKKK